MLDAVRGHGASKPLPQHEGSCFSLCLKNRGLKAAVSSMQHVLIGGCRHGSRILWIPFLCSFFSFTLSALDRGRQTASPSVCEPEKALPLVARLILSLPWMDYGKWSRLRKRVLLCGCCLAFLLPCSFAYALQPDRKISQYAQNAWRIQDGFFPTLPWVVAQTADGNIWIGTQAGIVRFDGVRFVQLSPPGEEKLRSPSVTAVGRTSDGSLWIGTADGDLWRWKNQLLTSYPDLISSLISAILEDKCGTAWTT